jgi:hypothetical protein
MLKQICSKNCCQKDNFEKQALMSLYLTAVYLVSHLIRNFIVLL